MEHLNCEYFIHTHYGYVYYDLNYNGNPIIYNLVVEEEYRNHGYSKILLKLVISEIRRYTEAQIYIQVKSDMVPKNKLIELYTKFDLEILDDD